MKHILSILKVTFIGGLIFLVPFFIVVMILVKTFDILRRLISPWVVKLGIQAIEGRLAIALIVILILVLICFLAGIVARSGVARARFPVLDMITARLIPGYQILKAQSSEKGAMNVQNPWQAVCIKLETSWRIGFIVEQGSGDYKTVFVPESPKMDSGEVHVLAVQEMEFVPIPADQAHNCLRQFGAGAGAILGRIKSAAGSTPASDKKA
ncbi:MAG TPA: hypothetical protein VG890_16235 [Puia sp.]|nr:hypothetical protein [Puia sp.]